MSRKKQDDPIVIGRSSFGFDPSLAAERQELRQLAETLSGLADSLASATGNGRALAYAPRYAEAAETIKRAMRQLNELPPVRM